jgi:hypothetical protein
MLAGYRGWPPDALAAEDGCVVAAGTLLCVVLVDVALTGSPE